MSLLLKLVVMVVMMMMMTHVDDEWLHHCHQFIRLSLPLLVLRVVLLLLLLRSRVISSFLHLCVVLGI